MPGVRKVEIDFAKKEAYVTADKNSLDTKAMIQAVEKAGYQASVKNEGAH